MKQDWSNFKDTEGKYNSDLPDDQAGRSNETRNIFEIGYWFYILGRRSRYELLLRIAKVSILLSSSRLRQSI